MCNIFGILNGCYHKKLLSLSMRRVSVNEGVINLYTLLNGMCCGVVFIAVTRPAAHDRQHRPSSE